MYTLCKPMMVLLEAKGNRDFWNVSNDFLIDKPRKDIHIYIHNVDTQFVHILVHRADGNQFQTLKILILEQRKKEVPIKFQS